MLTVERKVNSMEVPSFVLRIAISFRERVFLGELQKLSRLKETKASGIFLLFLILEKENKQT